MSWERQRKLKENKLHTIEEIRDMISGIGDARQKAFASMLYLTAGRISEVVAIERKSISFQIVKGRKIFKIEMPNRKHKHKHFKDIPIVIGEFTTPILQIESQLAQFVWSFCAKMPIEFKLFQISDRQARTWLTKATPYNPHWLRHMRATHLVVYKDFPPFQLQKYMGHSDLRPIKHYIELSTTDIVDKM